jgi:hypothetical protein
MCSCWPLLPLIAAALLADPAVSAALLETRKSNAVTQSWQSLACGHSELGSALQQILKIAFSSVSVQICTVYFFPSFPFIILSFHFVTARTCF